MKIQILQKQIDQTDLDLIARQNYGEMTKAVVDIEREIVAIGGEMHADAEKVLLENGSSQSNLWGINIFPAKPKDKMIEFTSLINIRPAVDNRSMEVLDQDIREKISQIILKMIKI